MAKALLPSLLLTGRVCTADALHTHAALMNLLHDLQADCVLPVKDNELTLRADLQTSFADPLAHFMQARPWIDTVSYHPRRAFDLLFARGSP